ncbi:MAG TPA: CPBP family glutamic-type intramembrane protease [Ohtaekwangia sp.]
MSSPKRLLFEIIAVVITGLGKFLFVDYLHIKFWYIITASLFWIGYILYIISTDRKAFQHWGFRKEGFIQSLKWILPAATFAVGGFVFYGLRENTLLINWHILPIMVLYPIWGTLQQFLIIGLIAGNLNSLKSIHIPKPISILSASLLFSIVHFPSLPLVVSTFILAIFYAVVYLKFRNLWILGLFHGWLGGLFYFFVLHRDPWIEFLEAIQ